MESKYLVNGDIRCDRILLILVDGSCFGETTRQNALSLAEETGLDLVQVQDGQDGQPIVCKILDYGKMLYRQSKKEKHSKGKALKEIRFRVNTAEHDMQTKNNRVFVFLEKGHRVKYVMLLPSGRRRDKGNAMDIFVSHLSLFSTRARWNDIDKSSYAISTILIPLTVGSTHD